jgi:hypothetical protein
MSKQYDGSDITALNETFQGLPFFRKYIEYIEYRIYQILQENPHPHLVTVYRLTESFVDIELLTPVNELPDYDEASIVAAARSVKEHLQGLGIFYMDWKSDNLGLKGTTYRLFDFDGAGYFRQGWIIQPMPYWSYRQAAEKGLTDPKEMDDYAFDLNLKSVIVNVKK